MCIFSECPGELLADPALQLQILLTNPQCVRAGRNLRSLGQTACLSQAIAFHLLTSVWSPVPCVGMQASSLELARAIAFGTGS